MSNDSPLPGMPSLTIRYVFSERLLPSSRRNAPAFNHEECQELTTILRTLDGEYRSLSLSACLLILFLANPSPGQAALRTHIVAKIMLRMSKCFGCSAEPIPTSVLVSWRQQHGTPATHLKASSERGLLPVGRKVVDLAVSAVCLGIPYLFVDRSRHHRYDVESGIRSAAGSMIAVGAVACMIVSCKRLYNRR